MNSITGTWKLLSFELLKADGTKIKPFGTDINGILIYQDNGYMSGIVSGEGRPFVSSTATKGISNEERAAIAKNFIAYAGRYVVVNDIVNHEIDVSFLPNLIGEKYHQNRFEITNKILETRSMAMDLENDNMVILKWERI